MDERPDRTLDEEKHYRTKVVVEALRRYSELPGESRTAVDRNLRMLTAEEQRFVARRFGFDGSGLSSLEELAEEFGLDWQGARETEAVALSKLFHPLMRWPEPTEFSPRWQLDAETLLLRVGVLLHHADELRMQLGVTREELLQAEARIRHLEDLNRILRRELYETAGSADRAWVGKVATLVLGLVGGFLGGVGQAGGEELLTSLQETETSAVVVINHCGVERP